MELRGKHVILGVTGSIAAYKAVYLLRLLVKEQADVRVIMTPAATEFVGPVTFSALSGKPVLSEFFGEGSGDWNSHVEMGVQADLMLIAPVTATTLGKMAHGIADNLLITTYLSARCPVIVAPAMDADMYEHPSTRRNLEILNDWGLRIIEPGQGELASGLEGRGRMAEPDEILRYVETVEEVSSKKKFLNKRVLVTAGPTQETIDPVRYIGNRSSGKMGYAIAEAFARAGAAVDLISGPVGIETQMPGITVHRVTAASEMYEACKKHIGKADVAVFNAAVADFTPVEPLEEKATRGDEGWTLRLRATKDIAGEMGKTKRADQVFVGFALETGDGLERAREKLVAKNFDLIVLNSLQEPGGGFHTDTNKVTLIRHSGEHEVLELKPKSEVAEDLVERIADMGLPE